MNSNKIPSPGGSKMTGEGKGLLLNYNVHQKPLWIKEGWLL